MIRVPSAPRPSASCIAQLTTWQKDIDALTDHKRQVLLAKDLFGRKNIKANQTFNTIKDILTSHCQGSRRCAYCEDSIADEVEHIRPKDHFPSLCFVWTNYVYACGTCNGPKRNKFAMFTGSDHTLVRYGDRAWPKHAAPPIGKDVMINVRSEDPFDFGLLDLTSMIFVPLDETGGLGAQRFTYTFEEVLNLNHREQLTKARHNAFTGFRDRLRAYVSEKEKDPCSLVLPNIIAGIQGMGHQTVWCEFKRYSREGWLAKANPELKDLFDRAPEALGW